MAQRVLEILTKTDLTPKWSLNQKGRSHKQSNHCLKFEDSWTQGSGVDTNLRSTVAQMRFSGGLGKSDKNYEDSWVGEDWQKNNNWWMDDDYCTNRDYWMEEDYTILEDWQDDKKLMDEQWFSYGGGLLNRRGLTEEQQLKDVQWVQTSDNSQVDGQQCDCLYYWI